MALAVTDRAQRLSICEQLRTDYQPRFDPFDAGVNPWANPTTIGVEILFGGRRKAWDTSARYARRRWLMGPAVEYRAITAADREVRERLDEYLAGLHRSGQ
jgi:hypothetical protein